ncbi:MAG TPA: helix-turn-helix domain-containing protein [Burkholderiaceae bacterium]|nr:helix-turn-helix domain-containing protein [Burkholderiaceae bacterium]
MSYQDMGWATQQQLPSLQKLILIMLASHVNPKTRQCNPSHATLARECGMSITAIKKHMAAIEQAGLITVQRTTKEGLKQSNHYTLSTPQGVGRHATIDGRHAPYGRSPRDPGIGRHAAIKQKEETVIETTQQEVSEEVKQQRLTMLKNLSQAIASKSMQAAFIESEI